MYLKKLAYKYFVCKNANVQYEYEKYVNEHLDEHNKKRFEHWKILLKLKYHYQIRGKKEHLFYDFSLNQNINLSLLTGPESEAASRPPVYHWVKGLFEYDIISFDVFDTLLLRKVNLPRDVFSILGEQLDILDFNNIRFQAEQEARKLHMTLYGNTEVTIFDIYDLIEKKTGLKKDEGVKAEFELEKDLCYANPYMKCAFDILKARGKRIFILSDMYFPKEYIKKLLNINGYDGIEEIFVSCDLKGGKKSGFMFKFLKERLSLNSKVVHIGDNPIADIQPASTLGIDTRYYANIQTFGNAYREKGMSPLIRSAYAGLVNAKMHTGLEHYTTQYEFGYNYGGIFVLGYIHWIHKRAKEKKIDKLLFMARDGYIYKKIYDKFYSDIPSELVFWSREASLKYACDYNRTDFLNRVINQKIGKNVTIKSLLNTLDLDSLVFKLKQYNLKEDELIHEGNKKELSEFLIKNWTLILEYQSKGGEAAHAYYSKIIGNSKNIALIDIGWRGDNQLGLKKLIEKKWKMDCTVYCLMAGSILSEKNQTFMLEGILESYMFSVFNNTSLYASFTKNSAINMAIFEMFSQAPFPSFSGFDKNGNLKFGYAEVENYEIIKEILKGIEDFCDDYKYYFGKYPFLFNIPGYDAYIPFRGITKAYNIAENAIGNMHFQQSVGLDYSKQKVENFSKIMRQSIHKNL